MENSILVVSAVQASTGLGASQPPRFLDWLRQRLRDQKYLAGVIEGYVEWVRRFILFHQKQHPREMKAEAYRAFLDHVGSCGSFAWAEQQEARAALVFVYRELNATPGGTAGQEPPPLLEQVRSVLRVGHYALRTEECYLQWIKRFILFHHKRHPLEMGARKWRSS
jgi:hypothetical protein